MFDWDKEYSDHVDFWAKLAKKKEWLEYVRDRVKTLQLDPNLKNLGRDVGNRIKELEKQDLLTTKEK